MSYKKFFLFIGFFIFFFSCRGKEKTALLNTEVFPETENLTYIIQTVQGESLGVMNISIKREGEFISFTQDFPYSEIKMDSKTLKPVSSLFRVMLPRGPLEISSEFKKDEILLKAKMPGGERDTTIKAEGDFYHSDFMLMVPRVLPFVNGKTYELKSFVPVRAQIFDVKVNFVGVEEISAGKKKFKGYHVIFDYGTEKHDAYYEEKSPHRLLYYTNGRNSIVLKL